MKGLVVQDFGISVTSFGDMYGSAQAEDTRQNWKAFYRSGKTYLEDSKHGVD